jgi:hypothetical protein
VALLVGLSNTGAQTAGWFVHVVEFLQRPSGGNQTGKMMPFEDIVTDNITCAAVESGWSRGKPVTKLTLMWPSIRPQQANMAGFATAFKLFGYSAFTRHKEFPDLAQRHLIVLILLIVRAVRANRKGEIAIGIFCYHSHSQRREGCDGENGTNAA